jgi:dephospho-coA kinase
MFKYAFVVTGSIGSGKSTFLKLIKDRGYGVIDADLIAHKQLEIIKNDIVAEFGEQILTNKKIDRKKIGEIVFNDDLKLKKLEAILHPRIRAEIVNQSKILEAIKKPYFVDIPLFFERIKNYNKFNQIIVVYAPKEILILRVMNRNKLKYEVAKSRVELQTDIEKKKNLANFVVDNSRDLKHLKKQIDKILAIINLNINSINLE